MCRHTQVMYKYYTILHKSLEKIQSLLFRVSFRHCRINIVITASNTERLPCTRQNITDIACNVSFVLSLQQAVGQELSEPIITDEVSSVFSKDSS